MEKNVKNNVEYEVITNLYPTAEKNVKIVFQLSKNAIIGFSAHCLYEAMNSKLPNHWHIDPLGLIPGFANQAFGFFLTNNSPELIIELKKNLKESQNSNNLENLYVDNINEKTMHYEVDKNNLARILIFEDEENVTSKYTSVSLSFSADGMNLFGVKLQDTFCNFTDGEQYDLEVILGSKIQSVTFECCNLGVIADYDETLI